MPPTRINILIYSGPGASPSSLHHATTTLRAVLGSHYAIAPLSPTQLLSEPWPPTCALLVFPGGADLGYARVLNGAGNRRIKQYVSSGGRFLGFCAGGYYGSGKCEFEVGRVGMEVLGERELGFWRGGCRGGAFGGFEYGSERGARAVEVKVCEGFGGGRVRVYYNGGGVFVREEGVGQDGVQVLASYMGELDVDGGEERAAVVYCGVGEGGVVLTGPHPEFSGLSLNRNEPSGGKDYPKVVDALVEDEQKRTDFMKACLTKLGLECTKEEQAVPTLSLMHLSASQPETVSELLHSWQEAGILTKDGDRETIKGEADTFVVEHDPDALNMADLHNALPTPQHPSEPPDYTTIPKRLYPHEQTHPSSTSTPSFNHSLYYSALRTYHPSSPPTYGTPLLYASTITSTSTLLASNPTLLSHLPTGLTATATTQLSGRGRGSNVWVSPPGSLMFSTILHHSLFLSQSAPVVFIQYLAALAIVSGIHNAAPGYEKLPIKLKWPNDIYALDPSKPAKEKSYVKIGGILVNSSYAGGDYTLILGIGLNALNPAPTTSLSHLAAAANLPPPQLETLLASILASFSGLYTRFCRTGWDRVFEERYYDLWLHSGQVVTLEAEGVRARIEGISSDWGLLVAEEVGEEGRGTGKRWRLQSDSNSFDFFRGLVGRKV